MSAKKTHLNEYLDTHFQLRRKHSSSVVTHNVSHRRQMGERLYIDARNTVRREKKTVTLSEHRITGMPGHAPCRPTAAPSVASDGNFPGAGSGLSYGI